MISAREIIEAASILSLQPRVVEKDYVLGWLLAGIYAHPSLADSWVFKGGTCLKKCYFETYRFSEDLDFTITDADRMTVPFLIDAFTELCRWVNVESGIETFPDRLRFEAYRNPRGRLSCEGRISYRGPVSPRGDPPRVKLDLTIDELLVREPVIRDVSHPYSDCPAGGIAARCYAFDEIFGEKLRALGERCRPRDLYDVVHLFRRDDAQSTGTAVRDVLQAKCDHKGLPVPSAIALAARRDELSADWSGMLAHQLQALPPVEEFWEALPGLFGWLETSAPPPRPQALAPAESETPVYRTGMGAGRTGFGPAASAMESVYFAAANRLCIDLGYKGRTRRIEPYSLRRTKEGHLLLYGTKASSGETRCYRVDRIEGAVVTSQSFTPRFAVELTQSGPTAVPQARFGKHQALGTRSQRSSQRLRSIGSRYVYKCTICGRRFVRTTRTATMRPHNDFHGWPCRGRRSVLVDTEW